MEVLKEERANRYGTKGECQWERNEERAKESTTKERAKEKWIKKEGAKGEGANREGAKKERVQLAAED